MISIDIINGTADRATSRTDSPPIGLNLYVLSGISGESVLDVARSAVPFMVSMLVIVVVLAWFPGLFMWLV